MRHAVGSLSRWTIYSACKHIVHAQWNTLTKADTQRHTKPLVYTHTHTHTHHWFAASNSRISNACKTYNTKHVRIGSVLCCCLCVFFIVYAFLFFILYSLFFILSLRSDIHKTPNSQYFNIVRFTIYNYILLIRYYIIAHSKEYVQHRRIEENAIIFWSLRRYDASVVSIRR